MFTPPPLALKTKVIMLYEETLTNQQLLTTAMILLQGEPVLIRREQSEVVKPSENVGLVVFFWYLQFRIILLRKDLLNQQC